MQVKMAGRSIHVVHLLVIAAILPLIIAAIFAATVRLSNTDRFDPAYFTPELITEYDFPSAVAIDLETALRENDTALMARLEGLRQTHNFTPSEKATLERVNYTNNDRYREVMMIDRGTYRAHRYYLALEQGRWVLVPDDAFFYLDSGHWMGVWLPLSTVWWLVEVTVILMLLIAFYGARFRAEWGKRHGETL
jgi:hypothetical protein